MLFLCHAVYILYCGLITFIFINEIFMEWLSLWEKDLVSNFGATKVKYNNTRMKNRNLNKICYSIIRKHILSSLYKFSDTISSFFDSLKWYFLVHLTSRQCDMMIRWNFLKLWIFCPIEAWNIYFNCSSYSKLFQRSQIFDFRGHFSG